MCLLYYIRHKDYRPFVHPPSRLCYPPWILKRGGLESSGQRLISSVGKTKRIAFIIFQCTFIFQNHLTAKLSRGQFIQHWKQGFPFVCPLCFYVTLRGPLLDSETGWTGELWSKTNLLNWQNYENSINLFIPAEKKKCIIFLRFFQIFGFFDHPILDTRIFVRPPSSVTLVLPPLDSETRWTGELWSKTYLLNWQN